MKQTELLQEIRKMRFEEAYEGWQTGNLTQEEAARLLGVCARSFRRQINRFEESGLDGLLDKRLTQPSNRRAGLDEIQTVIEKYKSKHIGWNAKHFHRWYKKEGGQRSYSWVKKTLQGVNLISKAEKKGAHRKRRDRSPWPGMMIHQDGSTHAWIAGAVWDLIVTMDDATSEHYSMFFVEEEGTQSSLRGVRDVINRRGLFSTFYSDRGSHYWHTPEAGGKVDKRNPTQFGKAMKQLGIEMIAAYSPQARGRSERAFKTHQGRLPQELALAGIVNMEQANDYLINTYMPAFNAEFMQQAMEEGSAFVGWIGGDLNDILCEQFERVVGNDNCVQFENLTLQIPVDQQRCHYVKTKVRVLRHINGILSVFHGPRCLARYDQHGELIRASLALSA